MKLKTACFLLSILVAACTARQEKSVRTTSGNPILEGWYADPEGAIFGDEYWIFPTFSSTYERQVFFDAFSSKDLIHWTKHEKILDTAGVSWAHKAMWAPSIIENGGRYFLFFGANDIQRPGGPYWNSEDTLGHSGGIGVAVANHPGGPYEDYLGKPLIGDFYNDAQPIDQFVFRDTDGTHYMFYGGWRHCNLGILKDDFTGFIPWENGDLFREITPGGYVEGPFMFLRDEKYYFMWSEGNWGDDTYTVAYAMAESATGPYHRVGTILKSDPQIATGAGHHSVINLPGTGLWYIIYHRRPIPTQGRDHRVTCIDPLEFNDDGTIRQVKMSFEGVPGQLIRSGKE